MILPEGRQADRTDRIREMGGKDMHREYTVHQLAGLAGVSARTLRYYDGIGLLKPARVTEAGYRLYGGAEVDRLQQILLYRAMGMELSRIARVLDQPGFDRRKALREHLAALEEQQERTARLIHTVRQTIEKEEGRITMTDQEKFEGLKRTLVEENEAQYGREVRERYGDPAADAANARMLGLNAEEYAAMRTLDEEIRAGLAAAVKAGLSADSPAAQTLAEKHRDWLAYTWGTVEPAAHAALAQGYVEDARFTAYYDAETPGCAALLCEAVRLFEAARPGGTTA